MTENWKFYFCRVNDKSASIFVDLGLRDEAPISAKKWLLWVWIYFERPRTDGLSDSSEAPILFEIEDALNPAVTSRVGGIPCGRITTDGRREFYFYAETKEGFIDAVKAVFAGFTGYKFDIGAQEDPHWEQYLGVLYPCPEDLERIANGDVLDLLERQGDVHSVPREVQHWIYFRSGESRALFKKDVINAGFNVTSESNVGGDEPFGISVARIQSVERNAIDNTVIDLFRLAQQCGGNYDGWETPVKTQ